MRKNTILTLIIVLFIAGLMYLLISDNKKTDKWSGKYNLYISNTNFPVVFEDGEWSKELKEFVITDLNCLYNSAEYKKNYRTNPVKAKIDNKYIFSTNCLYLAKRYKPVFIDNSFDYPFGNIISVDNSDYLFVPTNLMQLYKKRISTCNIPDNFHKEVENFISGIKDMTPKQLRDSFAMVEYGNSSPYVETTVSLSDCQEFIKMFNEKYKSVSFSVLYILKGVEFNSMLGDDIKYVDDNSLVLYTCILENSDNSRNYDFRYRQLLYTNRIFKQFIILGGE